MGWVDFVRRHARAVVFAVLVGAVASAAHVATHLEMNTDTEDMLSPDLPFRRDSIELTRLFPQFSNNILIVLDGEDADRVNDGADALVARLRESPELYGEVFDPLSDPYFRHSALLFLDVDELRGVTNRLAEAQPLLGPLSRDESLRGLFGVLGQAADALREGRGDVPAELATALGAVADVVEAQNAGRPGRLSWQSLMAGDAGGTARPRLVLIQPAVNFHSLALGGDAMDGLRATARDLGLAPERGVRVRLTGWVPLTQEELETVANGMGLAALLSLGLVLGLLFLALRSPRLVAATLVTLLAGLVYTAGFASVAVGRLNLLSVAFAVLFIGLSVDFGIHFALRFREEIDAGLDPADALGRATAGVGGALTLSAVAAAIGFFSFLPTDYRGLAELGLISGAGMLIALAANLTLLPALLALAPPRPAATAIRPATSRVVARAAALPERHPRAALAGAAVLSALALFALPRVRFDFDPLHLRNPHVESMETLRDLMDDPRTSPYVSTVLAPDLDAAVAMGERLDALPEVDGTSTLADYVPDDQDEKLAILDEAALFLLPSLGGTPKTPSDAEAERGAVVDLAERLDAWLATPGPDGPAPARAASRRLAAALDRFDATPSALAELRDRVLSGLPGRLASLEDALSAAPVGLADLPADLRERYVAPDGRARLEVYPVEDLQQRDALERFVAAVRTVAPHATGAPVVIVEAGRAIVHAFLEAAALSVALITVLLAVVLRRARDVVLVLVPLALSVLLTIAVTVVLELPFNFANVVVLPLQFALGVAGAIHLVLRARAGAGADAAFASSTPRAVLYSGLTTIGSFGTIALSAHPGTASMGILLTLAIVLTLATTLLVLPALLVHFGDVAAAGPEAAAAHD